MIINQVIPIWLMCIICLAIIVINVKEKNKLRFIRQILISFLLFLINLRIMVPSKNVDVINNNLDVLIVIDSTISMIAEDYDKNTPRLSAVKADCNYIMDNLAGARFSVISFNNESQIKIPFTFDQNAASNAIDTIEVMESLYSKGSSLNIPLKDMRNCLESSIKNDNRKRVVFFISDGEITNEEKLDSYIELKKYVDDGAVLGYGTSIGGYMKDANSYSDISSYLKDTTSYPYSNAVSKIDENNLKSIANDLNISYVHMEKQSNIDKKLKEIINNSNANNLNSKKSSYTDIYYIFVIPLCLLLFYECIYFKRRIVK